MSQKFSRRGILTAGLGAAGALAAGKLAETRGGRAGGQSRAAAGGRHPR